MPGAHRPRGLAAPRSWLPHVGLGVAAVVALTGCELEEVTIVDVEAVVVAEVYADVATDPEDHRLLALLHWTLNSDTAGLAPLSDSRITVREPGGVTFVLGNDDIDECTGSFPFDEVNVCFRASDADAMLLRPGMLLEVTIELPDGGELFGATRVPAAFELIDVPPVCRLDPDALFPLAWTRSEGAWAYINETFMRGLREALRPEQIPVRDDPMYLLGLSVSNQDTTIVFPNEFGIFNRFDLEPALALRLQTGVPGGVLSEVSITAVDRNYVNWARGGNFNPSGQVRVPSLAGDGTGVFASTVSRGFSIQSDVRDAGSAPDCVTP